MSNNEIKVVETNKDNLVTKSNILIEANYKLGVTEQKIILCLASNIQPSDSDFKVYTLPIKKFHSLLGLKGEPKYSELRKITKDLMKKVFELHIDNKVIQVAWLSYVAYNKNEGTIDLRFDPFLKPYLLELKKEFTSYKLENVIKLKSSYAIRIYELLKQYERLQKRTISINELRKAIGASDVYPAYGNFKQRILEPSLKEISKHTDIDFDYEEIKVGRKVEKIIFKINSKKRALKPKDSFRKRLDEFQSVEYDKAKKTAYNLGFTLSKDTYQSWEATYGSEKVQSVLESLIGQKGIKNPIGLIIYILNQQKEEEEEETESDLLLKELVPKYQNKREILPSWFIEKDAVQYLVKRLGIDHETAYLSFTKIKETLFETLGIQDHDSEKESENELDNDKFERIRAIQEKYKKKKEL